MSRSSDLHIRLDDALKLRLSTGAREKGLRLSELVREVLEAAAFHLDLERVAPGSATDDFSFRTLEPAELRDRACTELADRFRRFWRARPEEDQLRWLRARLPEVPALRGADPTAVLLELRSRGADPADVVTEVRLRAEEAP